MCNNTAKKTQSSACIGVSIFVNNTIIAFCE